MVWLCRKVGYFRCHHFGGRRTKTRPTFLDPQRDTKPHEFFVYKRDHYRCRYCSCRVIPNVVLKLFSTVIGSALFGIGGKRVERHGAAVAFHACADHVIPHCLGGRTNPENLVTACWACNFAKANYTLQEIGLDDPFQREPQALGDWDGLMSLVPQLEQRLSATAHVTRGRVGKPKSGSAKQRTSRVPKGVGNVSIALLRRWLTEWEQNGNRAPLHWKSTRVRFVEKNLETIKIQIKDFTP